MTDKKTLRELNKLVSARANERYILSKLKTLRYKKIGAKNLKNLIECLRWKDVDYNKKVKIKMSKTSMRWYDGQPYETFIEYFNRWLKKDKLKEIKKVASKYQIIIPCECNIESIGQINDTSSIIRLKKESRSTARDLKNLGVDENYFFINTKLFISYYHHVHSPISGKLIRMTPIEGEDNFFGKNPLWFLEFETAKKPVFLILVGESAVQDFNFLVKKNDYIEIADNLGYFAWGSQVLLLFDKNSYKGNILIKSRLHYFLGQPII